MTWNVTAETLCNLCSDPIGKKMDAGHGLSWWSDGKGNAYHQDCADSMRIAELEAECDRLRSERDDLRGQVADLKSVMRDAMAQGWMDKACEMIQAEVDSWPAEPHEPPHPGASGRVIGTTPIPRP